MQADWQLIETAPKDQRDVLIFDPSGGIVVAHWCERHIYWNGETLGIYHDPVDWTPTHWMPLPDPPKDSK